MRAITQDKAGGPEALKTIAFERPECRERDLLVKVSAAGLNQVDFKARNKFGTQQADTKAQIHGWDAVGIVQEVGKLVKRFKRGDRVYFAGDYTRNGSYAQYTAVDERLCALAPKRLPDPECAVLPLSVIATWEAFEERLGVPVDILSKHAPVHSVLIINGAGGIGSMAIQLAKRVFNLNVIATASRAESMQWCKELGADYVINHNEDLREQMKSIGFDFGVAYILCCAEAGLSWDSWPDLLLPFGKVCVLCCENQQQQEFNILEKLLAKSATIATQNVFTKAKYQVNMETQGRILRKAARLFDRGVLKTTLNYQFPSIEISKAQMLLESGSCIGKVAVLHPL